MEHDLPIFVPGWEDSTLGNMYAARCITGEVRNPHTVRTGIETMTALAEWYMRVSAQAVDRLLPDRRRHRRRLPDLRRADAAAGSAARRAALGLLLPDQRLHHELRLVFRAPRRTRRSPGRSWAIDTPKFLIESDATIVAPLLFAHVLGW